MVFVLLLFIISRFILFLSVPFLQTLGNYFGFKIDTDTWNGVENSFLNPWTAFDSESYILLAQFGYIEEKRTAFFPLYPMLIKLLSLVGISPNLAGFLVSLFSFLGAIAIFYLVLKRLGKDNYPLWLLALSPITVFFTAVYTESLFLLLSVSVFYLTLKKNWFWAGVIAGLASLTRNSGVILFFVVAIEMWKSYPSIWIYLKEVIIKNMVGVLLFLLYPAFLWVQFGDPLKFVHIQSEYWHRHFTLPWQTLWLEIQNIITNPQLYFISILNFLFLGIIVWMLFKWKEVRPSLLVFVLLSALMPMLSPPYWNEIPYSTGFNRYFLVLFPIYIFLADRIKHKLGRIVFLELWVGIAILFLTSFIAKQFIG